MKQVLAILVAVGLPYYCLAQFVGNPYLFPTGGGGTVSYDTSASGAGGTGGATVTINITVGSNANRVLYVGAGSGGNSGADYITSVSSSVNGSFTEVAQISDSNWVNSQIWRLVNPSTGAHVITVSYTQDQVQECAMAISLYDVNTGSPDGTPNTVNGSGTTVTGTVTLSSGGMALGMLVTDSETGVSVTTGTQRQEVENVGTDTAYSMATNTGTGSTNVVWAQTSNGYAAVVIPVNPQ